MGISDFNSAFANNRTQAALLWQEYTILETQKPFQRPESARGCQEKIVDSSGVVRANMSPVPACP